VFKAFTGYTDTAVIAGKLHNTECMSYGPGSLQYAHKPDEFVEIRDIIRCEKVINHLVMSLCGEK
jgi:succinyl-diaminopimelate desuccinylase